MAVTEEDKGRRSAAKKRAPRRKVALPQALADDIRTRVDPEDFDAYVIEVLERQAQRERLAELIAAHEREQGPLPQEYLDEAYEAFREAERKEAKRRAANL
ncbi:hypothetical protein CLV63_109112 [Murinocardiopsis flavida]|uniref:CopG family transcriptional regulator n=1 Tax=Murinocardiopsis flavida TaxID=645275 RepID=A0A2P8DIX0_9ACTN|nr:hypothetical protein [Murinocardiopsis flavida]PSK97109.1 hypothetical protein CLV63_109112 [Murinocardiopsis flavida]